MIVSLQAKVHPRLRMNKSGFNLIIANHGGLRGIEDWILTIMGMLQTVGRDVSIGDRFAIDKLNVVLEGFSDEFLDEIESAAKRGCKIIIIATEYITGNTFNKFWESDSLDYVLLQAARLRLGRSLIKRIFPQRWGQRHNRVHEFTKRFRNFVKAAKFAQSIWVAEPLEAPNYQQLLGPDKPIVAFPYCWFEPLYKEISGLYGNGQKTHDLFFSGALTDYRKQVIGELEAGGFSAIKLSPTTPLFLRNHFADSARIILDLKKNRDWGYISNLRVHYHLQRGDFVVCEKRKNACCLQPYLFQAGDSLSSSISQLLQEKNNLAQLGHENLERFRTERPAARLVPELLERSGL